MTDAPANPPMDQAEIDLRAFTLAAIDRFCEVNGFPTPPLNEKRVQGCVRFMGAAPDGRRFALAYQVDKDPRP